MSDLTLEHAQTLIATALRTGTDHGWLISAAVIDRHGNLVALARQDGSTLASGLSAQAKAWTARSATGTTGRAKGRPAGRPSRGR